MNGGGACAVIKKMKRTITLLPLIFSVGIAHAGVYDSGDLDQAYFYLNQLRVRAGMTEFSPNRQLEQSAFNHANYLADNFLTGHYESDGTPGFTGVAPKDRTAFAGYRSLAVSENVSSGSPDSIDSIDGLMSAIYHRLGFLDLANNEIGIGIGKVSLSDPSAHSVYVYNMGNSGLNALCEGPAFSGFGRYYYNVCEPNININATDFEDAQVMVQGNNPNIVLWPTDGDSDVPPAFFEESPDPLPDYSVSGYPISIQFNPLTFMDVDVTEFKLYRESDNTEVQPTRLLTESTDPNGKLSALEYALFPLARLDWETAYRVQATYTSSSGADTLIWRFKTRGVGVPLYTVQGKDEVISISPNTSALAVYVPPTARFSKISQVNYRYNSGMTVDTKFIDGNTLRINLTGNLGQRATFSFSGGRSFVVRISANTAEACEPATLFPELKAHLPILHYTPYQGETRVLWMDLAYQGNLFEVSNYGVKDNVVGACEPATLSSELKMHIPTLHYTPLAGETAVFWANLGLVDSDKLVFEVTNYGPK
jgi:hypothetical protein